MVSSNAVCFQNDSHPKFSRLQFPHLVMGHNIFLKSILCLSCCSPYLFKSNKRYILYSVHSMLVQVENGTKKLQQTPLHSQFTRYRVEIVWNRSTSTGTDARWERGTLGGELTKFSFLFSAQLPLSQNSNLNCFLCYFLCSILKTLRFLSKLSRQAVNKFERLRVNTRELCRSCMGQFGFFLTFLWTYFQLKCLMSNNSWSINNRSPPS